MKFSGTQLCKGGTVCDICRANNRTGKAFRAALLAGASFDDVPDESFDCVRELRPGLRNLPKPPPPGLDLAEHRRGICAECPKNYKGPNARYCAVFGRCASSRRNWQSAITRPAGRCPDKPSRWTY